MHSCVLLGQPKADKNINCLLRFHGRRDIGGQFKHLKSLGVSGASVLPVLGALSVAHASAPKVDKLTIGDMEKAEDYLHKAIGELQKMRDRLLDCAEPVFVEKVEETMKIEDNNLWEHVLSVLRRVASCRRWSTSWISSSPMAARST